MKFERKWLVGALIVAVLAVTSTAPSVALSSVKLAAAARILPVSG